MANLVLVRTLTNGIQTRLKLSQTSNLLVTPDASYQLVDSDTPQAVANLILKRNGDGLCVEVDAEWVIQIEGFFITDVNALFMVDDGSSRGIHITSSSRLASGGDGVTGVVWGASADKMGLTAALVY